MDLPSRGDGRPTAIVIVGMAGAGKTTFLSNLYAHLHLQGKKVYGVNLDPAVDSVPFPVNVDIRKTVNYKAVIENYGLGPNGAILTSLNLYATKFDRVLELIEKRRGKLDYVLIDTPGQIEVFNWSASGTIILDALAISMPTVVAFMIDAVRSQRPTTLMANMLYACSVLYKSKLPFVGVFTKTDLADPTEPMTWTRDPLKFADAANEEGSYASTLSNSCASALSEFYETIPLIRFAARTEVSRSAQGLADFQKAADGELLSDYYDAYLGWIRAQREKLIIKRRKQDEAELKRVDMDVDNTTADVDSDE